MMPTRYCWIRSLREKWLSAKGVVGFWPANKVAPDTSVDVKVDSSLIKLEFTPAADQKSSRATEFITCRFHCSCTKQITRIISVHLVLPSGELKSISKI
jgi:cobalamin-dependent methionine synthase I